MPITTNHRKPAGYLVLRTTVSDWVNLNGGGARAANTAGETVSSMHITQMQWSVAPGANGAGHWLVKRGANTIAKLSGTGVCNYQEFGLQLEASNGDKIANCAVTLVDTTHGSLVIRLHKKSGE